MKNRANNFVTSFLSRIAGVRKNKNQDGTAIVIALLIMVLLMGFVALAISRTTSETVASANDAYESRTFDAAHASLEIMTRNFNKIFEVKLNSDAADETRIEGQKPPVFDLDYSFNQDITQTDATRSVILTEGQFQGLTALRDGWRLDTTATDLQSGVQVALHRNFFNNRIPIFQFGIFYDDDLEFHPGPRFDFGGRVHSNGSLFLAAGTRLNFSSKVTAKDYIFSDVQKNGTPASYWGQNVWIRNASGVFVNLQYTMGSVLQNPVNGAPVSPSPTPAIPLPTAYNSANWPTNQGLFGGNLLANQQSLDLPLKLNSDIAGLNLGLIELVKRGKTVGDLWNDGVGTVPGGDLVVPVTVANQDDRITQGERYYNKTGIRVNLADSKAKLPGCADAAGAAVVGSCGIRLDGEITGRLEGEVGAVAASIAVNGRGYQPPTMTDNYRATRINGDRFYLPGKEVWIKVETVVYNAAAQTYDTVDITEDILSLGVTEEAPRITTGNTFLMTDPNYGVGVRNDSRSVIKLQRFMFGGSAVPQQPSAGGSYIQNASFGLPSTVQNYVIAASIPTLPAGNNCASPGITRVNSGTFPNGTLGDRQIHFKNAVSSLFAGQIGCVVPFPINMFDTREGLYNDTTAIFNPTAVGNYGSGAATKVPWAGVMSMIDIDIANLGRFLNGNFDGGVNPGLPAAGTPFSVANTRGLLSTDIPQPDNVVPKSGGWVLYVSDRRGDYDFDGEYDMEDVYGPNDGILQPGEDFQKNVLQIGFGSLQADYVNEAVMYRGNTANPCLTENTCEFSDEAAVFEHRYYRRGVRLINGQTLPGGYVPPPGDPRDTRGFTVASENAVYVQGNYNAVGIASVGVPTPHTDYLPLSTTAGDVPASIAADAVIILSNNWRDANSFSSPFAYSSTIRRAGETHMRFALLTGDTQSSLNGVPNQGGGDPRMSGGVHNFKRFIENWSGIRFNYSGSIINLFNSHNNNAPFKCCSKVYGPPTRNWVFDATFLDINRIPPGTPFFQSIQITGFQRINQ